MTIVLVALGLVMLVERLWKHWVIVRFFRRPIPRAGADPQLVSILQPVLSGDPTMVTCLERGIQLKSRYQLELIWLVDKDDVEGEEICRTLRERYPDRTVQILRLSSAPEGNNPKVVKLIEGAKIARGEVICVLDDDTMLADESLERCLPFLDQPGVGLAFGLPYYVNFSAIWSSMVSTFVNSNSLLTYIPYTVLAAPFTINGMFYALRRTVLTEVGGFEAIVDIFADDFAVAQLLRSHGYRLAQTPLLHAISTQVKGPRHYLSLIQRWFVLPRESLLRHLSRYERLLVYGLGLVPALFPLLLLIIWLASFAHLALLLLLAYMGYTFALCIYLNISYLSRATPWSRLWWVPVMQILFPLQLLVALCSPQRINWRGNVVQVQRGGAFRYLRRRVVE